ncbi:MAG: hypothetical protein HQL56_18645 [Magnetococcales bacterium]|nr:hypothetical protein [Magnetococcales bacterium]
MLYAEGLPEPFPCWWPEKPILLDDTLQKNNTPQPERRLPGRPVSKKIATRNARLIAEAKRMREGAPNATIKEIVGKIKAASPKLTLAEKSLLRIVSHHI